MTTPQGNDRAANALHGALQDLRALHGLLDEYDATRDRSKLNQVSLKMKEILPTIKDLSMDPECKTRANAPLLIELSSGMKDAVTRTKGYNAEIATRRSSFTAATPPQVSPLASSSSVVSPLSRHAASGWLNKLGDKGIIKSWKRRWFSQKAERLYYYETKEETGLKGFVDLVLVLSVAESPKTKHGFEIRTKDRVYYLQAASDDERAQWMQMLSSWLDGRTGSGSPAAQNTTSNAAARRLSFSTSKLAASSANNGNTNGETSTLSRSGTRELSEGVVTATPAIAADRSAVARSTHASREASAEGVSAANNTTAAGSAPGSFREEEIRLLQQKLLSLEAKLDTSGKSVPTRSLSSASSSSSPSSSASSASSSPYQSGNIPPTNATHTGEATTTDLLTPPRSSTVARPQGASSAQLHSSSQPKQQDDAEERLQAMAKRLAAAEAEANTANTRLEQLSDELKRAREKQNALELQLKSAEQRVEGLTEDVTQLTKENRAKDEHIASLKDTSSSLISSVTPPTPREQLEETIAQLRQATHAHQTQNAYLASEIKKMQRDHMIELASKDEQLDGLRAQLEPTAGSNDLQADFLALQKLYFSALTVGIKLNLMLQGQPCNVDAASLWRKVQALNLHFSKWNEWVLARLEDALDE